MYEIQREIRLSRRIILRLSRIGHRYDEVVGIRSAGDSLYARSDSVGYPVSASEWLTWSLEKTRVRNEEQGEEQQKKSHIYDVDGCATENGCWFS